MDAARKREWGRRLRAEGPLLAVQAAARLRAAN